MRTEFKVFLVIGLVILGGAVFYWSNQGERQADLGLDQTLIQEEGLDLLQAGDQQTPFFGGTNVERPTQESLRTPSNPPRDQNRNTGRATPNPTESLSVNPPRRSPTGNAQPTSRPIADAGATGANPPVETSSDPAAPTSRNADGAAAQTPPPASQPTATDAARPNPQTPTVRPAPAVREHVIVSGDNFTRLAEKYYGDVQLVKLIVDANPQVDPVRLKVGQKVKIPAPPTGDARQPTSRPRSQPASPPSPGVRDALYVVGAGDTLTLIAREVLGDGSRWREIFELNRDLLKSPDVVPVGTKLRLPK